MVMGVRALGPDEPVFVVDDDYREELALKARLFAEDASLRVGAEPGSDAIVWDCVGFVLRRLAREHPESFALREVGRAVVFENRRLGEETRLEPGEPASLPAPPMQWLGSQVQEDLCVLDGERPGVPLVAGCLCFPSMWSLREKLGKSLSAIHEPVPSFEAKLGRSTSLLMGRLKVETPVWRMNWGIYPTPRLDLEPHTSPEWEHALEEVTAENAGRTLFVRVERQTLTRLPTTAGILFTIRTHVSALEEEARDPDRRARILATARSVPPETQRYKRLASYLPALVDYLEGH